MPTSKRLKPSDDAQWVRNLNGLWLLEHVLADACVACVYFELAKGYKS
jgi:hypothetical protein